MVVAVNKMDLVGYSQQVFEQIERDFRAVLETVSDTRALLPADQRARRRQRGAPQSFTCLGSTAPVCSKYLEELPLRKKGKSAAAFRFPVQRVVRPSHSFRGYAGTVAAGEITSRRCTITVLPSAKQTQVAEITTFDGNLLPARRPGKRSHLRSLADDLDISRGDMLVSAQELPALTDSFEATLVWLNEKPAELNKRYRLKQNTRQDWAEIKGIEYRININTLAHEPANTLEMNAIGMAAIETARPLIFDSYRTNRTTGSFILIDPATNATVAAGLIEQSTRSF